MKGIAVICAWVCLCIPFKTSFGQLHRPDIVRDAITVNDLHVGTKYKQSEFVERLGSKPTRVKQPSAEDEYQNAYTLYYGDDRFYYIDGEFYGFDLFTSAYSVNNLIRVGDFVRKIDALGGVVKYEEDEDVRVVYWRPSTEPSYEWAVVWFYYDEEGVITGIMCFINDL